MLRVQTADQNSPLLHRAVYTLNKTFPLFLIHTINKRRVEGVIESESGEGKLRPILTPDLGGWKLPVILSTDWTQVM